MLYDPRTGARQSATTQGILQKMGIRMEDQSSDDAFTPKKITDISNETPGAIREQPGEEGDDLPSVNTEVKDQRSMLSEKAQTVGQISLTTTTSKQAQALFKNLDYKSILHMIREVEEQIHVYSEVFDKMRALGK